MALGFGLYNGVSIGSVTTTLRYSFAGQHVGKVKVSCGAEDVNSRHSLLLYSSGISRDYALVR